jgi:uncharacterized protein YdeI (YjbR/CyaY-like superfamily)
MKTLLARTVDRWREWLFAHHDTASEIWLIFYKRAGDVTSIAHADALDEALCFGWVDSLVKRLDDRRYAIKFTPRRLDSKWSEKNRARYAELQAIGRLQQAGINRPPTDRRYAPRPPRYQLPDKLPAYVARALRKRPPAWRYFQTLPPSERRRYVGWIETAKREETKTRRLNEAIRLLSAGKRLGLK